MILFITHKPLHDFLKPMPKSTGPFIAGHIREGPCGAFGRYGGKYKTIHLKYIAFADVKGTFVCIDGAWRPHTCGFAFHPDGLQRVIDRMSGHKVELRDQPVVIDVLLRDPRGQFCFFNISLMLYKTQQVKTFLSA